VKPHRGAFPAPSSAVISSIGLLIVIIFWRTDWPTASQSPSPCNSRPTAPLASATAGELRGYFSLALPWSAGKLQQKPADHQSQQAQEKSLLWDRH
jgi:hypothetical protein